MGESVRESIVVSASPQAVFDVVVDFPSYPEWQEEIREVEVLETDERGRGTKVAFRIDAKAFRTRYTLAYTYDDTSMSWDLVEADQISELTGAYHLDEREDGTTEVTYELTVTPTIRLPGFVRRQAARRIVDGALRGVKQRAEANG